MFIIGKLLLKAMCVRVAKRCFVKPGFSVSESSDVPIHPRSTGNSEGLLRVRGKALNRKSGYEMEH